jgi:predicted  nucleic acid-binding Zn-ribbon protein
MNAIISMFTSNLMAIYLLGMSFVVVLAVVFCLSIRYYMKAKDLVPYMHKIKELVEKISELQHKVEDVEKQLKEKLAEVTHAEKLIQQGKDAEDWLRDHKEEIETTQKIIEKVRAEIETGKVQKTDLDRQISERQQQLVELEKKAVEAEVKVKDAEKSVEDIRKENAELTIQVPALRAERDALKDDIQTQKARVAELFQKIQEQTDLLNKANGELEKLTGLIAAKKAELESLQQSIEKAHKQVSEKVREVADLEARAGIAQETLTKLTAQREESGEKWKNLDTPIINERLMRDVGKNLEEKQWLKDFSDRLLNNGFVFDERAIRAFHTGLKCAKQTPLVVLAGISGTGKSLLPELYASALGMNFLPVPVQPRWDSPQDLFGFYNYMEGRYKATELARLLWQFDHYNNPPAKKKYTVDNLPLNLVLLDEMNLARVEYYFSDLLSKLETRNGLNTEDKQERKKAEIELECNAADKIDSMRHLFVSSSTLFVGTMNEDESTQTLSDKVIDRANVLRFGRPKMLGDDNKQSVKEPDKSSFIATYAKDGRISVKMWNGWCKGLDDAKEETDGLGFLRKTVTPVVEALDKVYRSYGFRVDKAMKLYVMNYPGNYKEAVADQIEMKILPKLNGVELQDEHFGEVKDAMLVAIDATGDNKLRTAFLDACPEGGTFFRWRGVMR